MRDTRVFMRMHAMDVGKRYPTFVDVFSYDKDGTASLIETLYIDSVSDMNLDPQVMDRIKAGETIPVKLVEDTGHLE